MKFTGELNKTTQNRVEVCDRFLTSPERLKALARTALMDTPTEQAYDRLAHLAAKVLNAPLTIVSLISDTKQFFKAAHGMPAPYDTLREIPIDGSICRYTLQGQPIIVDDAKDDELLKHHPATKPWGIGSFIALPIITQEGHVLGAFCAVHPEAHHWTDDEIEILTELTASIMTEVTLRTEVMALQIERELRERFVATLTHDLRTPLTAVKMAAQLLMHREPSPEVLQSLLSRISENIDRADFMIRDLLDASRIKAGEKVPLRIEDCNLNDLVQSTLEDFGTIHGERFSVDANETINGRWDPNAIRRVIENLAGNAVKYGMSSSPIKVGLHLTGDRVEISVHNEGNPIPESEQLGLFEPFHRSDTAKKSSQKGWGIGLTLVRGFAEAHGGKAYVKSSLENGTTFSIRMPLNSTPST